MGLDKIREQSSHHFSDISEIKFEQVSCLRMVNGAGNFHYCSSLGLESP